MSDFLPKSMLFPGFLEPAPFMVIKRQVGGLTKLSREEKASIMSASILAALATVNFDERWYLSAYLDVQAAINKGEFTSGLHHYELIGFFESRFPVEIEVDENFYGKAYPDIKQAINLGVLPSAKIHFVTKGYKEGRIPSSTYSFSRQDVLPKIKKIKSHVAAEFSNEVELKRVSVS